VSLDWQLLQYPEHAGLQRWVRDLNHVYRDEPALHEVDFEGAGFTWIDCSDNEHSVVSLARRARHSERLTVAVVNFTPVPRSGYRLGVPKAGRYREILNTDAEMFGGSNMGNCGTVQSDEAGHHGRPASVVITLPPLARECWRMSMMSPQAQKVNPFFLGGETIQVSFPTDGMSHDEKLQSLRSKTLMRRQSPGVHGPSVEHPAIRQCSSQGDRAPRFCRAHFLRIENSIE